MFRDTNFEKDLFKKIFIFLINNSKERFLLDKNILNKFLIEDNDEIMDETDFDFKDRFKVSNISDDELYDVINSIEPKIVWNYLKNVLIELKASIYGLYLIENNKINNSFFFFKNDNKEVFINLKNIYNISKYLSHNSDFVTLGTNFKNLKLDSQKRFFSEYFDPNINLRNNLSYQGDGDNRRSILSLIKEGWKEININLVWNYLLYNGLLSEFKVMLDLTDNDLLSQNTKHKRSMIQAKLYDIFKKIENGLNQIIF